MDKSSNFCTMGTCGAAEIVTQRGDGRSYVIPNDFRGKNEIQTSQSSSDRCTMVCKVLKIAYHSPMLTGEIYEFSVYSICYIIHILKIVNLTNKKQNPTSMHCVASFPMILGGKTRSKPATLTRTHLISGPKSRVLKSTFLK